jgi:hypothetical protein
LIGAQTILGDFRPNVSDHAINETALLSWSSHRG